MLKKANTSQRPRIKPGRTAAVPAKGAKPAYLQELIAPALPKRSANRLRSENDPTHPDQRPAPRWNNTGLGNWLKKKTRTLRRHGPGGVEPGQPEALEIDSELPEPKVKVEAAVPSRRADLAFDAAVDHAGTYGRRVLRGALLTANHGSRKIETPAPVALAPDLPGLTMPGAFPSGTPEPAPEPAESRGLRARLVQAPGKVRDTVQDRVDMGLYAGAVSQAGLFATGARLAAEKQLRQSGHERMVDLAGAFLPEPPGKARGLAARVVFETGTKSAGLVAQGGMQAIGRGLDGPVVAGRSMPGAFDTSESVADSEYEQVLEQALAHGQDMAQGAASAAGNAVQHLAASVAASMPSLPAMPSLPVPSLPALPSLPLPRSLGRLAASTGDQLEQALKSTKPP